MAAEREFKARTIAKAVKIAAKELGIEQEDLQYDIISHGASGIFGLTGVKKARIRVLLSEAPASTPLHLEEDRPYFSADDEDADPVAANDYPTGSNEETQEMVYQIGEEMLRRIVDAISPEAAIKVQRQNDRINFDIEGGEAGILIGKRGQTLEAIQVLVDKAVRRLNGHTVRVTIDVEGYLKNKETNLIRTAERVAQRVKSKGRPASIGFMNAQDRRIIHLALKDDHGVRTQSVGDGNYRKLMVYPKRRTPRHY
ncbi:MAG: RNA-binding cell elongation regulator Jag/EloR [Desulfobacterales bacterium]|nr:RNA-binding cell elongation regulator Jag/EloR [Desulfobacterales bacterium]MDJ0873959.1 RNA-binding cell elongation regulator Jag/EloR [Desulfobacterales bacterium]